MDAADMKLPHAVRPRAEEIVAITDAVCAEHLDEEYAALCRSLVAKLGRKRPSPLMRGDLRNWAAGVVYALGQLNFISDRTQSPHATADQLSEWLGVKKTTMANKARAIRTTLGLSRLDSEFMRRALIDSLPMAWLLQVDGLLIDIRYAPAPIQVQALQLGLIPYLPGQPPTSEDEIDRLVDVITVDCYGLAEEVTAFYEVFAAEVRLPAEATLAGARVEVTGFDIADDCAEVTALCRRGGAVHNVRASDLVFPPETPAGWIHAAYRRCLGLAPRPSAMPAGWQPDWL